MGISWVLHLQDLKMVNVNNIICIIEQRNTKIAKYSFWMSYYLNQVISVKNSVCFFHVHPLYNSGITETLWNNTCPFQRNCQYFILRQVRAHGVYTHNTEHNLLFIYPKRITFVCCVYELRNPKLETNVSKLQFHKTLE